MTAVPDLTAGLCLSNRANLAPSAWDDGAAPAEREAAVHACRACPLLGPCRDWVVTAMPGAANFRGVAGGLMGRGQIQAERKRRRAAGQGQDEGQALGKEHPDTPEPPPGRS